MDTSSRISSGHQAPDSSLLGDWLTVLGVPHTSDFTRKEEKGIPFKTWFGLSRELTKYGVDSQAYFLADKVQLLSIPTPYIAHTGGEEGGNIIVTSIGKESIEYLSLGVRKSTTPERFLQACDGNVFISKATSASKEPDLGLHRRLEFFNRSKKFVLLACVAALLVYAFIFNGLYRYVSIYFLTAIDIAGLYVTYLLVQKSLKIHNPKADRFCGVLQAGGCDDILSTPASKFFGLFGWSEVGFAYFSVSLAAMLMFPGALPWLALCNVICLPFTAWSIWYQKFRAKRWCTLCVTVQCSLWLLFLCYLTGGWLAQSFPISLDFFVLGVSYVGMMLLVNAIMPYIGKKE